jgi:hypothetical protein
LKEYRVIESCDSDHLASAVGNLLDDGWQLVGGIAYVVERDPDDRCLTFYYAQAMAR